MRIEGEFTSLGGQVTLTSPAWTSSAEVASTSSIALRSVPMCPAYTSSGTSSPSRVAITAASSMNTVGRCASYAPASIVNRSMAASVSAVTLPRSFGATQ
eukprot:9024505-Pyramimonas_sp.AAC.2